MAERVLSPLCPYAQSDTLLLPLLLTPAQTGVNEVKGQECLTG